MRGVIGKVQFAKAFYNNSRVAVPNPIQQAAPAGLDWDLFQGPAPRKSYFHDTWDYNWHWYGMVGIMEQQKRVTMQPMN